ncbi:MAG: EAL domain-containing protein [Acidimicrobiales bacterium]
MNFGRTQSNVLRIEQDLRKMALTAPIVARFQPLVRASDHTIEGFEALVRWQHPERRPRQPGSSYRRAEESGLIVQLGQLKLLLKRSVRSPSGNEQTGNSYRIAVNLSSQ